ncbi:MAG: hypothetical protein R3E88_03305 [Myxococcota bacterium]
MQRLVVPRPPTVRAQPVRTSAPARTSPRARRAHAAALACAFAVASVAAASPAAAEDGAAGADAAADAHGAHALHPPIGVSGGHTLARGGIAVGYSYDVASYDQLRERTNDVTATGYLSRTPFFASAPSRLRVERHEFALLVATTDRLSLLLEVPFVRAEMRNETASGSYTTESGGLGDIALSGVFLFMRHGSERLFFSTELGMPTGSISQRDDTPSGQRVLPYAMQPGSGVWHVETGLTYEGTLWKYTWGGQIATLFQLGDADVGDAHYTPGNRYAVTGWLAREWCDALSTSLRLRWHRWGNTSGRDTRMPIAESTANDPMRQRGERVDLLAGAEVRLPFAPRQALALEAGFPLLESLDGPAPSFDWSVRVGWRWSYP